MQLKTLKKEASRATVKHRSMRELAYIACMSSRSSMLVRAVREKLGAAGTDGDADGERSTPKRDLSGEMPPESTSKRAATTGNHPMTPLTDDQFRAMLHGDLTPPQPMGLLSTPPAPPASSA